MPDETGSFFDFDASMDNSAYHPEIQEDFYPTPSTRRMNNLRVGDDAAPSRSGRSSGKRKLRDEADEMTCLAMKEIVDHFRGGGGSGSSQGQSDETDHMMACINIMTDMGIPPKDRVKMWHYLEPRPLRQRTFQQLSEEDRRELIASVVHPDPPPGH